MLINTALQQQNVYSKKVWVVYFKNNLFGKKTPAVRDFCLLKCTPEINLLIIDILPHAYLKL